MTTRQLTVSKRSSLVDMLIPRNQGGSLPGPTDDYWYEPVGRMNAGQKVTGHTALTWSGAWCATNAIAGLFGQLPAKAYRKTADGREEATKHDVHRIISREPNPEMDSFTFWEMMTQWWVNYGNAFAEIQRLEESDRLFALWPIHPSRVTPERTPDGTWTGKWEIKSKIGKPKYLEASEVLNIVGALSDDGLIGKGVLTYAAQSIGIALAENQYKGDFYANGGRPSGILEHPKTLSPKARDELRREWREVHGKSNEVAVLWEGMKFNTVSVDPEHAKLGDSQLMSIQDASRFWDMPPHVLYELSKGTFANVEEMNRFLVSHSFGKRIVRVEKALDRQLFNEQEKKAGYYTKFNVDALLRGNPKEQAEIANILIGAGITNQDEERAKRDLNKIPEGLGSTYWVRRDMAPIDLAIKSAEKALESPDIGPTPPTPAVPDTPPVPGQNRIKKLRNRIRLLSLENRKLESIGGEFETAKANCIRLQESLNASEAESNRLNAALATAEHAIDEQKTLVDSLKSEQEQKSLEHVAIVAKLATAESELAAATEGSIALASEVERLRNLSEETERLRADAENRWNEAVVAGNALAVEVESLKSSIQTLESERDTLKATIAGLETDVASAIQTRVAAFEQIADLNASIATLTAEKAAVETLHAEAVASLQKANDELVAAREAATVLVGERDAANEAANKVRSQLAIVEKQQESTQKRLNSTEIELSDAQAALSKSEQLANEASDKCVAFSNKIVVLTDQAIEQRTEANKIADGLKSRVDDLATELGTLRAERDTLSKQVDSLTASRDALAISLADAKKAAEDAENDARDANAVAEAEKARSGEQFNEAKLTIAASIRSLLDESLQNLAAHEIEGVRSASRKPDQFKAIVGNYYHHLQERLVSQLTQAANALEKVGYERADVAKIASQYVSDSRTRIHNVYHTTNRDDLRVKVREETESWEGRRQSLLNWIGE